MIGCHALVFTGEFDTQGIASSVQRAQAAGFDLIEFPLMEPDTFDSATARQSAEAEGLHITASLGLPLEADISSDDPSIVAAGRRLLNVALVCIVVLPITPYGGMMGLDWWQQLIILAVVWKLSEFVFRKKKVEDVAGKGQPGV